MAAKKFLIVTASVGSGHEKAASAIAGSIKNMVPDAVIETVDFMAMSTSPINAFFKACYLNMLYFVPNLYEFMYQFTSDRRQGSVVKWAMATAMVRSLKVLIRRFQPDEIICTHPFPADALSSLSDKWRSHFRSAAVITDYSMHPMWLCPNMNTYFVACDSVKEQLVTDGIVADIVHVTGIPVSDAFGRELDQMGCRQQLKLDPNTPVVLMMGGGLGLGGMARALKQLESIQNRLQLVVVAGRNNELKRRIEQVADASHHNVQVWGYTDQIPVIMRAANILITKPGALTLTEAMTSGTPMVLHEPIPGPETDNARYMSGCGAAVWLHAGDSLSRIVEKLLDDPDRLRTMTARASEFSRPGSADNIVRHILKDLADHQLKK